MLRIIIQILQIWHLDSEGLETDKYPQGLRRCQELVGVDYVNFNLEIRVEIMTVPGVNKAAGLL